MNLGQLRSRARTRLDDNVQPYLHDDDRIDEALNDAVTEANLRGRFLIDSTTAAVVQIAVVAGQATYTLNPRIIVVRRAEFAPADGTRPTGALSRRSFDELDRFNACWRQHTGTRPRIVVQDLAQKNITLYPTPTVAGTLQLVVWRHPLDTERMDADSDEPVVPEEHHSTLIEWVVYDLSADKDKEVEDRNASADAFVKFEQEFGPRPTVQQLRKLAVDREGESDCFYF